MISMRRILLTILFLFLLTGCSEDAPVPTEIPTTATEAAAIPPETTVPPETESVFETIPATEPPPEPPAEQIEGGIQVLYGKLNIVGILSDGSHVSKYNISSDKSLRITSETAFENLYLQWDAIPGEYELHWEGGMQVCGSNGFLHEYITLPQAVTEVSFQFLQPSQKTLCEVSLYTEGSAPEGVQVWLPPCEEADILVFPTHSDDDVLFFGPLISYYAMERGLTVQTAFMVDHAWQKERGHERLNGLWELGVRHYPILGTAPDNGEHDFDFGMAFYANSNILQWQVEQIRRFRPLVIVGHDLDGEYGNCGHKVNAYYLVQAVEAANDPEVFPESAESWGLWDTPKFYLHLYPENEWYLDVNTPLTSDAKGRSPYQIAQDAFRYHVTQNTGYLYVHQEDGNRQWDCRPFGLVRSLVGLDSNADVMDHIDRDQWRN